MDGPHDLGGAHGLGPIDPEPEADEPVFHAEWESTALALTILSGALGRWNIDQSRHARERQHPVDYLRNSYYENWLAGLETLLLENGLVTREELLSGQSDGPADAALRERALTADRVAGMLARGRQADRQTDAAPRYSDGDEVRVVITHPRGHTRSPRYLRGRLGIIHAHHGAHAYPDESAEGRDVGVHLYSVRFAAEALWGTDAAGRSAVYADLWEPYLEPA